MTERETRLSEVDLLETYLNHNQIEHAAMRNYLSHRRNAIATEFADPAEAAVQGEDKGENENSSESQAGAGASDPGGSSEQPPTPNAQGDGTQSPTPDAANQAPSASA